ncbi:MAG: helix-turn-helix domain-containing protein [Elusimicrobia bacterium]|nr:helix-turn-helix domain-containing protein [Elusimicrobiota bacterium]
MERLLTVDEVADWLRVKPRTVYQWVHEGYIPLIKIGALVRFDHAAVAAWLKTRSVPGRAKRAVEFDVN